MVKTLSRGNQTLVPVIEDMLEGKAGKILVIDNDRDTCQIIQEILTRNNYYVEAYTDSRKAIERFKVYPFDLVITDLYMPDLSGWDVALQVKEKNQSIPVLLITGIQVNHNEEELRKRGVNNVIRKPMHVEKFLEIVTRTIGSRNE